MVRKIIRFLLVFTAGWGTIGYWFFKGHTDHMVPLMYVLIVVVSL